MNATPILFLLLLGVDEPASSATSRATVATSRPAPEFEFRPVRVIDHRERDVSAQFPSRFPKPRVDEWVAGSNPPPRTGLTVKCVLQGGDAKETWLVKNIHIDKVALDEGNWPDPYEGCWLEGMKIGEDDIEERIRFAMQSKLSGGEDEGPQVLDLDLGFKRPPRGARMITELKGVLVIEVATTRLAAIEIDKATFGKRIENSTLEKAGIRMTLNDPKESKPKDDPRTYQFISASFRGKLQNLVDVYPAEPPAQDDEPAGSAIDIVQKTSSGGSSWTQDNQEQTTWWTTSEKLPAGARLVAKVITSRRVVDVPFSFEEVFLPK